jgi:hypothetical protein
MGLLVPAESRMRARACRDLNSGATTWSGMSPGHDNETAPCGVSPINCTDPEHKEAAR